MKKNQNSAIPQEVDPQILSAIENRKCLFIASEVRSGSTYLAETLAYELNASFGFSAWHLTKELFSHLDRNSTVEQVLEAWHRLHLDTNGFVCAKIMCKALSVIKKLARDSSEIRDAFFGKNAYWLVVRRRDPVAQAVSLALADKTGLFHVYDNTIVTDDQVADISIAEIERALRAILMSDIYLEAFANSLAPAQGMTIFYDDFLSHEVELLQRIHAMCGFPPLNTEIYENRSKIVRTASARKKELQATFSEWLLSHYA